MHNPPFFHFLFLSKSPIINARIVILFTIGLLSKDGSIKIQLMV